MTTKLNMGCGNNLKPGYINIDKYEPTGMGDAQFLQLDLEAADHWLDSETGEFGKTYREWPFATSSVDEILFHHSLEHMGHHYDGFFHIMKEVHRVCRSAATVEIHVPHPRHNDFINDPTHVRIVTPMVLHMFSKKNNELWAKEGAPNTPLALQLDVDFEIFESLEVVEGRYHGLPEEQLRLKLLENLNVGKVYEIKMRVVK